MRNCQDMSRYHQIWYGIPTESYRSYDMFQCAFSLPPQKSLRPDTMTAMNPTCDVGCLNFQRFQLVQYILEDMLVRASGFETLVGGMAFSMLLDLI